MAWDLFTVDLLGGTKAYVLAAIEHATRRIRILGATAHPGGQWIGQQARNLCMDLDQAGANVKFVLHDRDATFHEGFDAVFTAAGLRIVRSGVRVPRMKPRVAYCTSWERSAARWRSCRLLCCVGVLGGGRAGWVRAGCRGLRLCGYIAAL